MRRIEGEEVSEEKSHRRPKIRKNHAADVFERDECVSNSVLYINVHKVA